MGKLHFVDWELESAILQEASFRLRAEKRAISTE